MSRPSDDTVSEVVQRLVDGVNPEQVILFGSRAPGDEREDSEIDLIVVESAPFGMARSRRKEAARLYEAVAGIDATTDILVYSRAELDAWRSSRNHVLGRAVRAGKVVHERTWQCP